MGRGYIISSQQDSQNTIFILSSIQICALSHAALIQLPQTESISIYLIIRKYTVQHKLYWMIWM
jgi:hypothetical protein